MRRLGVILALLALAAPAAAISKDAVPLAPTNPTLTVQSLVSPRTLPRTRRGPASLTLSARIGTTDGSRPSPLGKLVLDLDRHLSLRPRGFPACDGSSRDIRTPNPWSPCQNAIVGSGRIGVAVQLEGQPLASGRGALRVIKDASAGAPTLRALAFVRQPITTAITIPIAIGRRPDGRTRLSLEIPEIANGTGSLTELKMRLGRHHRSFDLLAASCSAGRLSTRATATFLDGTVLRRLSLQECASASRPLSRR